MTKGTHKALMRRMAGGPVRDDAPETEAGLIARALSRSASRAAQERLGLPLVSGALTSDHPLPDEVPARVPEHGLCLRIANPSGARGVVILSAELAAVLLEAYLVGAPGAEPAPPRAPTRTDVAILRDWLDRMLADLGAALPAGPELGWLRGWAFERIVPDPRQLSFMLADGAFEGLALPIAPELHPAREGVFDLVVERHAAPRAPTAARPDQWQAQLRAHVLAAETQLEAVLWRERIALATVAGWAPGTVLRLPERALDEVRLEAAGHRHVGLGRLGQSHGMRAVRLSSTGQPPGQSGGQNGSQNGGQTSDPAQGGRAAEPGAAGGQGRALMPAGAAAGAASGGIEVPGTAFAPARPSLAES